MVATSRKPLNLLDTPQNVCFVYHVVGGALGTRTPTVRTAGLQGVTQRRSTAENASFLARLLTHSET